MGGGGDGGGSDTFLILDLPKNSTVGCDAKAIGIGTSDFKGIRAIPPDPHFIWVSAPGAMSRSGYWFVTGEGGRVRAKQWDNFDEALAQPAGVPGDVAGLSPRLVPYGFAGDEEAARLWPRLTSAIGEKLLSRVTAARPARGDGDGGDGDDAPEWPVDTSDSASGDGPGPGGLDFLFPEGDVDLAAIDHDTNSTTTTTTTATTTPDTTASILRLVDHPGTGVTGADLVGEVQFAFLTGLHLSSLSCVGQWWHLVLRVVLRGHGLALARPALARDLIQTLHAQMVYNEKYIAGGPDGTAATTTTTTTAATTTTGGDGDGEEAEEGPGYEQQQLQLQERVRHEYGGADAQGTSILDIVPGNKRRLREALALFKRRLDEALSAGGPAVTDEQRAVGRAFSDLEAWFWRFGWDLRVDAAGERRKGAGDDGDEDDDGFDDDDDDDDDGDYQPVIVDLDENGREVGLVSFN